MAELQKQKQGTKAKEKVRRWVVEISSLSLAMVLVFHVGGTQTSVSLGCCWQGDAHLTESGDGEAGGDSPPHLQVSSAGEVVWDVSRPPGRRGEQVPRCLGDKGKKGNNTGFQPSTVSQRRRLRMAFGLELGK